jgi:micrococcal nuclease
MTVVPRRVPTAASRPSPSASTGHDPSVGDGDDPSARTGHESAARAPGRDAATALGRPGRAATRRPGGGRPGCATRTTPIAIVALLALVAAAVLTTAVVTGSGPPAGDRPAAGEATVVRVVDGDTLVVALGDVTETVRLIGIDTPESVARDRPDECFGAEASQRLAALLPPGTTVRLARDVEPRDLYDRLLAYVHRPEDGLFVNADLVAGGFAEAQDYPPNTTHRADLEQAERAARRAGLGLWSVCGGPDVPLAGAGRPP